MELFANECQVDVLCPFIVFVRYTKRFADISLRVQWCVILLSNKVHVYETVCKYKSRDTSSAPSL